MIFRLQHSPFSVSSPVSLSCIALCSSFDRAIRFHSHHWYSGYRSTGQTWCAVVASTILPYLLLSLHRYRSLRNIFSLIIHFLDLLSRHRLMRLRRGIYTPFGVCCGFGQAFRGPVCNPLCGSHHNLFLRFLNALLSRLKISGV